ncbi:MAG TPA: hypothetical protein VFO95_02450, partial [Gemmatimonadales bacterium]|nr:hypothetical protein [Gemmatimonadales bacterium]
MTPENRRRFGAVAALVLGLFAALSLIPGLRTGPVGETLGGFLWKTLGIGALGFPLLGFAVGLAGFDRLPLLDMKRAAMLVSGLSLLVPFLVAVITQVSEGQFVGSLSEWTVTARVSGIAPAFLARSISSVVGQLGGVLVGFLALTGLTLGTIAWHPLQRLERIERPTNPRGSAVVPVEMPDDDEAEAAEGSRQPGRSRLVVPAPKKPKPARPGKEPP